MKPSPRAPRPVLAQEKGYRILVPALLVVLVLITAVILVLAGGVLVGLIPYPGR